jgi:O-methyltransferase domain/Dimerisation domain
VQSTKPSPHEQLHSIILGFRQARAVSLAAELDIADHLAKGPLDVAELAKRTKANASALFRVLRALESMGMFSQVSPRVFGNTEASEFLRKDVAGSHKAWILHCLAQGHGSFESWNELAYSVNTETASFDKVHGCDLWEFHRLNPEVDATFNEAVRNFSKGMTPIVTAAYEWKQFPVIADIGGGIGAQLISILDASPSTRGILFDQPHVGANPIGHERMEVVGGDFFESVPEGADAYLLRFILHDWSDPKAAAILATVRKAMKPSARLMVVESVISEGPEFHMGKWIDLNMLTMLGGRERSEAEFRDLLRSTGFELEATVPTGSPLSILLAKPV